MLVRKFPSNSIGEGCSLQADSWLDEVKAQPAAAASPPPFATMTPVAASSETQATDFPLPCSEVKIQTAQCPISKIPIKYQNA